MDSVSESLAGSINERGFLNSLYRKGFTHAKCISELFANSLDSMDKLDNTYNEVNKKIAFEVKEQNILMIDNGRGMSYNDANNMFDMHRENHKDDSSRGVSGIGAKPALSILSEKKLVQLLTRVPGGDYISITVPWDRIHNEGRYNKMISIRLMNDSEKIEFEKERQENDMITINGIHGTTIKFPNNNKLKKAIEYNFPLNIEEDEGINCLDRLSVIFGRDNFVSTYKVYNKIGKIYNLSKYNYLEGSDSDFYLGKSEDIIEMWVNSSENYRYIWRNTDGKRYEIRPSGGGLSKIPELCNINMNGYKEVGIYTVKTGLRKFTEFFDYDNPIIPDSSSEKNINPYHIEHIGKDSIDFLYSYKLVRNNQLIGLIQPPDGKVGSSRGNVMSFVGNIMLQCEVVYNPVSTQNSFQDHAMNIQENKNQYDGASVDKRFTRIVSAIKKSKFTDIWNYFEQRVKEYNNLTSNIVNNLNEPRNLTPEGSSTEDSANSSSAEEVVPVVTVVEEVVPVVTVVEEVVPVVTVVEEVVPVVTVVIVAEELVPNNSSDKIPSDVRPYRRGLVYSHEIIQQLERITGLFHPNEEYSDNATITMFNMLTNYGNN
jgi:hypothetical protein